MGNRKTFKKASFLDTGLLKLSTGDRIAVNRFKRKLLRKYGMASPQWKPLVEEAISKMGLVRSASKPSDLIELSYDPISQSIQILRDGKVTNCNMDRPTESLLESEEAIGVFPSIRFSGCC